MASAAGRANAALFGCLAAGALLQPAACDGPSEAASLSDADMELALAPVGALIESELSQFEQDLAALDASLQAWQLALQTSDGAAERLDAQDAFLEAMSTWQRIEVLQIGPAASSLSAVGGEDLRDEIYSWPDAVSGCRVDVHTAGEAWSAGDFFTANLVNSYGLDALEHLLWAPLTTECPTQIGIDADWTALGDAGVRSNRADYALVLVTHLDGQAADLRGRWSDELSSALTSGTSPWSTRSEALNAVYDSLFYLETRTKDRKLAEPLGLRDCTADCTLLIESPKSGRSVAWVAQNLLSAQALLLGGDNDGLDALLEAVGHGDLASQLDEALSTAIASAEALEEQPLDDLITGDLVTATALHDDVKAVTDILRGDLATVLLLEIPSEAAGDND